MQAESKNKKQAQVGSILGAPKINVAVKPISDLKNDVLLALHDERDSDFVFEDSQDLPMSSGGVFEASLSGDAPPPHSG